MYTNTNTYAKILYNNNENEVSVPTKETLNNKLYLKYFCKSDSTDNTNISELINSNLSTNSDTSINIEIIGVLNSFPININPPSSYTKAISINFNFSNCIIEGIVLNTLITINSRKIYNISIEGLNFDFSEYTVGTTNSATVLNFNYVAYNNNISFENCNVNLPILSPTDKFNFTWVYTNNPAANANGNFTISLNSCNCYCNSLSDYIQYHIFDYNGNLDTNKLAIFFNNCTGVKLDANGTVTNGVCYINNCILGNIDFYFDQLYICKDIHISNSNINIYTNNTTNSLIDNRYSVNIDNSNIKIVNKQSNTTTNFGLSIRSIILTCCDIYAQANTTYTLSNNADTGSNFRGGPIQLIGNRFKKDNDSNTVSITLNNTVLDFSTDNIGRISGSTGSTYYIPKYANSITNV